MLTMKLPIQITTYCILTTWLLSQAVAEYKLAVKGWAY